MQKGSILMSIKYFANFISRQNGPKFLSEKQISLFFHVEFGYNKYHTFRELPACIWILLITNYLTLNLASPTEVVRCTNSPKHTPSDRPTSNLLQQSIL